MPRPSKEIQMVTEVGVATRDLKVGRTWREKLPLALAIAAVLIAGLTFFAGVLYAVFLCGVTAGVVALAGERFGKWWTLPKWVLPTTIAIAAAILLSVLLTSLGHLIAITCLGAAVVLYVLQTIRK